MTNAPMTNSGARPSDHQDAAAVATAAGRLLLDLRRALDDPATDPAEVRAAGDRASHEFIVQLLAERFPDDAVLSEEGADDAARLGAERVWIVDPLDGTREFGEAGRSDWAVHVALVMAGRVVAAAVALPGRDLTLVTDPAPSLPPPRGGPPRLVVSRTRPPAVAEQLREQLAGELVPLGSAGAKAMAVVLGDADVYAHSGGQYEWDSAAPVGVAAAAGLHVSRLDGSPLVYNRAEPWLPDLLICRPELADTVLEVTRAG
jgi:3'(2'), 5'-bisphosphate nucleotidase